MPLYTYNIDNLALLPNSAIKEYEPDLAKLHKAYDYFEDIQFLGRLFTRELHRISTLQAPGEIAKPLKALLQSANANDIDNFVNQANRLLQTVQPTITFQQTKSLLALLAQEVRGLPRILLQLALSTPIIEDFDNKMRVSLTLSEDKLSLCFTAYNLKADIGDSPADMAIHYEFIIGNSGNVKIKEMNIVTSEPTLATACAQLHKTILILAEEKAKAEKRAHESAASQRLRYFSKLDTPNPQSPKFSRSTVRFFSPPVSNTASQRGSTYSSLIA